MFVDHYSFALFLLFVMFCVFCGLCFALCSFGGLAVWWFGGLVVCGVWLWVCGSSCVVGCVLIVASCAVCVVRCLLLVVWCVLCVVFCVI